MSEKALLRKQREWAKRDKEELDAAVQALLGHRHGRRYLYWLLDMSRAIGQNPFTGDPATTAFNCGEQNVGHRVLAHILEVDPDGFMGMMKEAENERSERTAASERRLAGDDGSVGGGDASGGGEEGGRDY